MMMRLDALIEGLGLRVERGSTASTLTDLVEDSRQVQSGCAFLARAGGAADGRRFISDAIARGAAAIITDIAPPPDLPKHVAWVRAEPSKGQDSSQGNADVRLAATLAERFFGHPAQTLQLIGVTGTNGKTTTATLIQHLLNATGIPCGLIGTLGVKWVSDSTNPDRPANPKLETGLTTPGPIDFSRTLALMRDQGCQAVVTEVSSHALEQGRVDALQFNVAVFTNLTGDHLDYHGTMDAYAAAKAKLFAQLDRTPGGGWAVINADDHYAPRMLDAFRGSATHVLRCTLHDATRSLQENQKPEIRNQKSECIATLLALTADASRARFDGPWGSVETTLPLVGRHNIANALQAAAAAHAVVDLTGTLQHALTHCPQVPGRLEKVSGFKSQASNSPRQVQNENQKPEIRNQKSEIKSQPSPAVLVDYAHTHDALENVLLTLRPLTAGRLLVVFGCGGDRDRAKRPKMAEVACRCADHVWITSDNPRTEDPQHIIDDILEGVPIGKQPAQSIGHTVFVEPDRAQAIRAAIRAAEPNDTVLIAGKGHEDYQILADRTIHFDDREEAAASLQQWITDAEMIQEATEKPRDGATQP